MKLVNISPENHPAYYINIDYIVSVGKLLTGEYFVTLISQKEYEQHKITEEAYNIILYYGRKAKI